MSELSNVSQEIERILDVVKEIKGSLPGLVQNVKNTVVVELEQAKVQKQLVAATKELNAITNKGSDAYKKAAKELELLQAKSQKLASQYDSMEQKVSKNTDAINKNAAANVTLSQKYNVLAGSMRQAHSMATSFNKEMGIQSLTFSNAYQTLIKYNSGMYTLTKSQRLFGESGSNISKAMAIFKNETKLGTVESLQFVNAFNKLHLGVQPTTQSIAKFAAEIEQSFGPGIERATEVSKTLQAIQNKFPPLFDSIRSAHRKMYDSMGRDSKEGQKQATQNIALMLAMGASQEELKTVMQMQSPTTKKEGDFLTTEEKQLKAAQESKDALVAMAKAAEPMFRTIADCLGGVYKLLGKSGTAALIFAGTIGTITTAANIALGPMGKLAKIGVQAFLNRGAGQVAGQVAGKVGGKAVASVAGQAAGRALPGFLSAGAGAAGTGAVGAGTAGTAGTAVAGTAGAAAGTSAAVAGAAIIGAAAIGAAVGMAIDRIPKLFGSDKKFSNMMGGAAARGSNKKYDKESLSVAASREKLGRETYGDKAFDEKAKGKLKDDMTGVEKYKAIGKIMQELRDEAAGLTAEEKKGIETAKAKLEETNKQALAYNAQKVTLSYQLDVQNKITEAISNRIAISEKFYNISAAQLDEEIASEKKKVEFAKAYLANTAKIAEQLAVNGLDIKKEELGKTPEEAMARIQKEQPKIEQELVTATIAQRKADSTGPNEDGTQTAEQIKALGKVNDLKAKSAAIQSQIKELQQASIVVETGGGNIADKQVKKQSVLITQEQKMQDALSQRLATQRKLYEQAHFGMGTSMKMLQEQINLEKERIRTAESYTAETRKHFENAHHITVEEMKSVENASGKEERERAISTLAAKYKDDTTDQATIEKKLSSYYVEHNKHLNTKMEAQSKIMEMTKGMREGYLNAIMAMQINAGEFSKIIGTQDKAQTQTMDTVERATGIGKLNTDAFGVRGNAQDIKAGGRDKPMLIFDKDRGAVAGVTQEQETARANQKHNELKGKTIQEQIDILTSQATSGAESISPEVLNAAVASGGMGLERANEIADKMDMPTELKERIGKGKAGIAVAAGNENNNPNDAVKNAENIVNKGKKELSPKDKAIERDLLQKSGDKQYQTRLEATGQDTNLDVSSIKSGSNIIGTILVAIDKNGELKETVIQVQDSIVNLQTAVGQDK